MAAPFAFLPRTVSKHTKEWQGISRPPPSPSPPPHPITDSEYEDSEDDPSSTTLDKAKDNEKQAHSKQSTITQDIAFLISLALSDYNIWLDTDLRWKLDACLTDEASADEAGFVPLNYLLRRAPFRGSLALARGQQEPCETEVVKALRTHASHTLQVQMRLPSSPSTSSVWYGNGKTSRKRDVGGYEVRRRDWPTLRDRPSRGWTHARWDEMTAYVECIPPQYRTVGGIARFTETLLISSSEQETDTGIEPRFRVQAVILPAHYLDKPGDMPKCKGYALVTFSTKGHLEALLRAWPWRRYCGPGPAHEDGDGDALPIVKEAHKYGLRMIPKARWDALNEEYLLYKQSLVDEMARTQMQMPRLGEDTTEHEHGEPSTSPHPRTKTQAQTQTTLSSRYPFGCLVFVRNIHPDTNKTTLKSLFGQAFQGRSGLDYVDFNKGMDTCYLRVASPDDATQLIEYFSCGAQQKAQAHGLDAMGQMPVQGGQAITMERIQGKKEELYWEKVPEKVRRQAVDNAVKAQLAPSPGRPSAAQTTSRRKKRTRDSENECQ